MSTEARRTRAEIVDAIGEAARQLLVARGPAAVTLREIAAAADVNLGLIHRYVGSKDDVIALVLDRHGTTARAVLASAEDLDDLLDLLASSPHLTDTGRLFAGLVLDGVDALRLKREFPIAEALTAALAEKHPEADPALTAALLQALVLGWELFSPFLLGAAGAEQSEDNGSLLRAALETLVAGTPGPGGK